MIGCTRGNHGAGPFPRFRDQRSEFPWLGCHVATLGLTLIAALIVAGPIRADRPEIRSSNRQLSLPDTPFSYHADLPKHVARYASAYDNTPPHNAITNHGATLGRVLFYDKSLSLNGTVSCASCHQQKRAFTDGRRVSVGFDGQAVRRNSMSLVNLRYYRRGKMFWDERAASLEEQVLMPIENHVEMGHDLDQLVPQLQRDPLYPALFANAFGDATVTRERMALALAQFVRALVSFRSRYDEGLSQVDSVHDPFPNFTDEENEGKSHFLGRARCAECHLDVFPSDGESEDVRQGAFFFVDVPVANGVDVGNPGEDVGLAEVTKRPTDEGKFKVSSLRNIELTGPYMHDGRFPILDQVVEHYNWSVRPHPNLDHRLADFSANGMALPEREKVALTRFLLTLTDQHLLTDPRFSDPFVQQD